MGVKFMIDVITREEFDALTKKVEGLQRLVAQLDWRTTDFIRLGPSTAPTLQNTPAPPFTMCETRNQADGTFSAE